MKRAGGVLLVTVTAAALAACGGGGTGGADVAGADAVTEASSEAGAEAGTGAGSTVIASFGGVMRGFDRAQFGFAAGVALPARGVYVELHAGGDSACPTMTSRTPDRTMVLAGVRVPAEHTPLTTADGLSLSLLDFQGDLSSSPAPQRATAVRVTVHEALLSPAESASVDLEIEGDFAGGATVRGRVRATHCNSLDE